MPQYVVQLSGGGSMTVNASDPQAAAANVASTGNTPVGYGGETSASSVARNTGATAGDGGYTAPAMNTQAVRKNEYGDDVFITPNGERTGTQIMQELAAAGWDNVGNPVDVYNRTASGGAAAGATTGGGTGGGTSTTTTTTQPPEKKTDYANLDQYNKDLEMANKAAYQAYLNAMLAHEGEKLAFEKAKQAFSETLSRASLLGTFEGQQTLQSQLQGANLLGTYQGQTTLAAQQQYFDQAMQQQTANQKAVQDYLTLLSGLRGPADYGQYLRTMASTPQGLQSLVGAAAGNQGRVPGFGVTGTPTQPVTLPGFMGQAAGGVTSPGAPGAAGGATGTSYEEYMTAARNLPPPSQIAPQNWNAMTDSQRKLLMSMYESAGWNVTDALEQYKSSLPKFGASQPQSGTVRLL